MTSNSSIELVIPDAPLWLTVKEVENIIANGIYMSEIQMKRAKLVAADIVMLKSQSHYESLNVVILDDEISNDHIKISKLTCYNLRVKNGDKIIVYKVASLPDGVSIIMVPVMNTLKDYAGNALDDLIKPYFQNSFLPLRSDNIFEIRDGERIFEFKVIITNPSFYCSVTPETTIHFLDTPVQCSYCNDKSIKKSIIIGGYSKEVAKIRHSVKLSLHNPKIFEDFGVEPLRGILLYGPAGTGKTTMAREIIDDIGAFFISICGNEIISSDAAESVSKLCLVFEKAVKNAPSVLLIDDLDVIAPRRDKNNNANERKIISQLMMLMDKNKYSKSVVVIATTNKIDSIDTALRRFGRFDQEIEIGVPDAKSRLEILKIHTQFMKLRDDVDLNQIAKATNGYVGRDLVTLCNEAAICQIRNKTLLIDVYDPNLNLEVLNSLKVTNNDFHEAINRTRGSALHETVSGVPSITLDDVGGLESAKREIEEIVQFQFEYPNKILEFDMVPSKGILLYGPPGCGKTLLAKAIANKYNINFISFKGSQIMTMWLRDSETNILDKVRQKTPCIVYINELDSIAQAYDSLNFGKLISRLMAEIDMILAEKNVFIFGATERPELIDKAFFEQGRLDQLIHITIPDFNSRLIILEGCLEKIQISDDLRLEDIAEGTEGFSGADLAQLCQRACKSAIHETIKTQTKMDNGNSEIVLPTLNLSHFEGIMSSSCKSVSDIDLHRYRIFECNMYNSRLPNHPADHLTDELEMNLQLESSSGHPTDKHLKSNDY